MSRAERQPLLRDENAEFGSVNNETSETNRSSTSNSTSSVNNTDSEDEQLWKKLERLVQNGNKEQIIKMKEFIEKKWKNGRKVKIVSIFVHLVLTVFWMLFLVRVSWYKRRNSAYVAPIATTVMLIYFILTMFNIRAIYKLKKTEPDPQQQQSGTIDLQLQSDSHSDVMSCLNFFKFLIDLGLKKWKLISSITLEVTFWLLFLVSVICMWGEKPWTSGIPLCCSNDNFTTCIDTPCDRQDATVNNLSLSVWINRLLVATILVLWSRLLIYTTIFRCFFELYISSFKVGTVLLKLATVYVVLFVAFSCCFWIIFGKMQMITSMLTPEKMVFYLFRMSLVDDDEEQFVAMQNYDCWSAYILIGGFLFVTAIMFFNVFVSVLPEQIPGKEEETESMLILQRAETLIYYRVFKTYMKEILCCKEEPNNDTTASITDESLI